MYRPTNACPSCQRNRVPAPLADIALCEPCCWREIRTCVANAGWIRRMFIRRRMQLVMADCRGRGMKLWHVRRLYAVTVEWWR